jgi:hypothetical protein
VEKMPEEITVMKVFKNIPEGKRSVAKLWRDGRANLNIWGKWVLQAGER